jgi:hypothetical protein
MGVFVGGVLCTRSALGIARSSLLGVRAGAEVVTFPSACFYAKQKLSEERTQRRRRLTKGPSEFREDRVDLPKAKGK